MPCGNLDMHRFFVPILLSSCNLDLDYWSSLQTQKSTDWKSFDSMGVSSMILVDNTYYSSIVYSIYCHIHMLYKLYIQWSMPMTDPLSDPKKELYKDFRKGIPSISWKPRLTISWIITNQFFWLQREGAACSGPLYTDALPEIRESNLFTVDVQHLG